MCSQVDMNNFNDLSVIINYASLGPHIGNLNIFINSKFCIFLESKTLKESTLSIIFYSTLVVIFSPKTSNSLRAREVVVLDGLRRHHILKIFSRKSLNNIYVRT
jgi:hypothetical protein